MFQGTHRGIWLVMRLQHSNGSHAGMHVQCMFTSRPCMSLTAH